VKGFEVLAGGLRSTKVDVLDGYWETLKVGFGDVEIDLIPSVRNFADLVDHLRAGRVDLIADLRHRRWLRGSGFLAGLSHDSR
jgi:hypothetical protein